MDTGIGLEKLSLVRLAIFGAFLSCTLIPGILIIYILQPKLFISLPTVKVILLAFAYTIPLYCLNVFNYVAKSETPNPQSSSLEGLKLVLESASAKYFLAGAFITMFAFFFAILCTILFSPIILNMPLLKVASKWHCLLGWVLLFEIFLINRSKAKPAKK